MEADTSGLICIAGPLTRERPANSRIVPGYQLSTTRSWTLSTSPFSLQLALRI